MCWILAFSDSSILIIAVDTGCYFTRSVTFYGKVPSHGPGVLDTVEQYIHPAFVSLYQPILSARGSTVSPLNESVES